ncbi:alanine racemase [Ferrimicrobium acidiphilum]|uniref:Alanine racemase n=1 Tax=Ferrimicrobium acidiphilum DSM 19497 TaxID=1121877 RepID=A0A0D8FXR7_9ACTN|nr:alanine racemase [Ferrimicrobium acidiphilum]KJE77744.1 alanine racemase [Ferrimicrobium acidiphilum DSM 19497]
MIPSLHRPTYVEVDLAAVRDNVARVHAFARANVGSSVKLGAVVKADAYGHGAIRIAEAASAAGAEVFFVATFDEAMALREGIDEPAIVMLSEPDPSMLGEVIRYRITPTVHTMTTLRCMIDVVDSLSGRDRSLYHPSLQLEIETGLRRMGSDASAAVALARGARSARIDVAGVYSHFARADEGEEGRDSVMKQVRCLNDVYRQIVDQLDARPLLHVANTAGLVNYPQTGFDLVRLGIGMYGYGAPELCVRPALRLVSRVARIHELPGAGGVSYGHRQLFPEGTSIATIPIGYADGYRRGLFEGGAEVLIRGQRHRLAGVVAMDYVMVAVGDPTVEVGDEVVLIGDQGSESIGADELASRLSTISYEILTGISVRVPRNYRG